MPIKYPSKYQPKYYNPNWAPYSQEKVTWDYYKNKNMKKFTLQIRPSWFPDISAWKKKK